MLHEIFTFQFKIKTVMTLLFGKVFNRTTSFTQAARSNKFKKRYDFSELFLASIIKQFTLMALADRIYGSKYSLKITYFLNKHRLV